MTDSELIDALGGPSAVAKLLEVTPQAVSQWREKGIPRARKMYLRLVRPDLFPPKPEPAKQAA
jgi:DNA-binding transcriptional regulator YdaS (Cro superfamily)